MFSRDDILDIYRSLPPENTPQSEKSEELPLLIRNLSGNSFITAHGLRQDFERIVTTEAARIPVKSASSDLDVGVDVVLQLIRGNPTLALLSQDGSSIIPKEERDAIVMDLEDMMAKELIFKAKFTQSRDIHQECLASVLRIPSVKGSIADDTEDYLMSKAYSTALSDEMSKKLIEALEKNETILFGSQSLSGTPPTWLVQQHLDQLSSKNFDGNTLSSQLHIKQEHDVIRCTPKQSLLSQQYEVVAELQSGASFAVGIEDFGRTFRELYTSSEALEKHLTESPSIAILGAYAVSTERLSKLAGKAGLKINEQSYLDLKSLITPEVPGEIEELVLDNVTQKVLTTVSDDGKAALRIGNFLVTDKTYQSMQQAVLSIAELQAKLQWDSLRDTPDKDPKFQMADVLAVTAEKRDASGDTQVLHVVAQQKESEVAAAEQFSVTISDLESKNENDFSMFWAEKVSQRVYNYREGLKSIDETKLNEQLSDLLSSYLQKDLLPDAVSKSRSQGLQRSRRTRKNVNRFEATLKTSKSDVTSILSTLEKFGKKQGIAETEVEAAEAAKKVSIQDMVRRMQKPKTDAPSMFLSLVVILFAKHHRGVVYATGKFAPKLLKQLKTKLGDGGYEQVEKWKELAKAGTLSKEDRTAMVQMAEEATG